MKVTIKDLTAFTTAYTNIKAEKMSINLAYKLSKIMNEVYEAIEFYRDKYNQYLSIYAQQEEDGKYKVSGSNVLLKTETLLEAKDKFRELDNYEFTLNITKIPLKELDILQLSPEDMSGLLPFIDE